MNDDEQRREQTHVHERPLVLILRLESTRRFTANAGVRSMMNVFSSKQPNQQLTHSLESSKVQLLLLLLLSVHSCACMWIPPEL